MERRESLVLRENLIKRPSLEFERHSLIGLESHQSCVSQSHRSLSHFQISHWSWLTSSWHQTNVRQLSICDLYSPTFLSESVCRSSLSLFEGKLDIKKCPASLWPSTLRVRHQHVKSQCDSSKSLLIPYFVYRFQSQYSIFEVQCPSLLTFMTDPADPLQCPCFPGHSPKSRVHDNFYFFLVFLLVLKMCPQFYVPSILYVLENMKCEL